MKKILSLSILFTLLFLISTTIYATDITLYDIAEKFNNSDLIISYKENYSMNYEAQVIGNVLKITGDDNYLMECPLNDTILTIECNTTNDFAFFNLYFASEIIDSIGQLHGYPEGSLSTTISLDEVKNYTLENEGLHISKSSNNTLIYKIDISKKVPLIDVSDKYITVEEFYSDEYFLNLLKNDGSYQDIKPYGIIFYKEGYGNIINVYTSEADQLTHRALKTILSAFEVIFDSKQAAAYFYKNYSSIDLGNKTFDGINVEINPTLDEFEQSLFGNRPLIKLTIDKEIVFNKMKSTSSADIEAFENYKNTKFSINNQEPEQEPENDSSNDKNEIDNNTPTNTTDFENNINNIPNENLNTLNNIIDESDNTLTPESTLPNTGVPSLFIIITISLIAVFFFYEMNGKYKGL